MTRSYQDLMTDARHAAREISLDDLAARLRVPSGFTLVDVREAEEHRAGHIPGAVSVPRGFLESRIESVAPARDAPLVLYCAGGTLAALAARTLQEMGYSRVESANPGFTQWSDRQIGRAHV